jgi:hypothetical protein
MTIGSAAVARDEPGAIEIERRVEHALGLSTGHEDVLTAVVVERFSIESAVESFEAQARDVERPSHSFLVAHQSEPVPPSSKVTSTRLSLTL